MKILTFPDSDTCFLTSPKIIVYPDFGTPQILTFPDRMNPAMYNVHEKWFQDKIIPTFFF